MQEYEVLIETINPCGGEAHSKKEFLDVEAESPEAYVRAEGEAHANKEFREIETDSPEAYVREQGRYPILDSGKNAAGDTVITTGDGKGVMIRYTFTA